MVVMFSSFLSPHMKPLCDQLYELCDKQFVYVECVSLSIERQRMGYALNMDVPYLKNMAGDIKGQTELANNADCVIINPGSASIDIVEQRVSQNKLTFYISERIFKRGLLKCLDPKLWKMVLFFVKHRNHNAYLLCLGKYVKKDFGTMLFAKNRSFKFGYFPQIKTYPKTKNEEENKKFVWVARMIDWKRPYFAIKTVRKLNDKGIKCTLKMLGDGKLFDKVKAYVQKNKLENMVELCGNVDNETARKCMADSDCLLFTSNKREGWGAVANEALSSGTPVVASDSIGCVDYLIKDGFNGVLFKTHSTSDAVKKIKGLSAEKYNILCGNTYKTLDVWNASNAAKRFMTVLEEIYREGSPLTVFDDGPMSKA